MVRGIRLRTDGRARRHEADQVADVHHADGLVERVVVDDEAGMGRVLEHLDELAERNVLLNRDDIGPRHHEVVEPALAQAQNVLEHPAFVGREAGVGGAAVLEQHLEVGADRGRAPAKHRARHAGQPRLARIRRRSVGAWHGVARSRIHCHARV
jgi:hypothetical protein